MRALSPLYVRCNPFALTVTALPSRVRVPPFRIFAAVWCRAATAAETCRAGAGLSSGGARFCVASGLAGPSSCRAFLLADLGGGLFIWRGAHRVACRAVRVAGREAVRVPFFWPGVASRAGPGRGAQGLEVRRSSPSSAQASARVHLGACPSRRLEQLEAAGKPVAELSRQAGGAPRVAG